jgi:hypothetical protein
MGKGYKKIRHLTKHVIDPMARLSLIVIIIIVCSGCMSSDERIFADLRSNLSKSHPWDSVSAEECIAAKDTACLHEAQRTIVAVDRLLRNGREQGLGKTLAAIQCNCRTNRQSTHQKDQCHGALAALYLFDSEKEDSVVMNFLRQLPEETVARIFLHYETCWLRNRRSSTHWISFIDTMKNVPEDAKIKALKTAARNGLVNNDCPLQIVKIPSLKTRILKALKKR